MTATTTQPETTATRLAKIGRLLRRSGPYIRDFIVHALGQVRILKKAYPGLMHFMIFWGVTIQVLGTIINILNMALFTPFVITTPRNNLYLAYELVMDLAGVSILLGVSLAFFRRFALRPKTLETRWDDTYALILLTLIPLFGFTTESFRLLSANPEWAIWSPIGNAVADLWRSLGISPETGALLHDAMVVVHATFALILVASIPFTKLRHLITAPLNVILHPRRKVGALEKIENIEETELLGVGKVTEFTSQQLLSFDACLQCGRCEAACPSTISGMPYSPRTFIRSLREISQTSLLKPDRNGKTEKGQLFEHFNENDPWYCTTCGACLELCPAFIRPPEEIVDLRRYQALTTGKVPKSIADTLRNLERQGNPWGMPAEDRIAWMEDLDIRELAPGDSTDVLFFLGCAAAYDERNKKITRSFARLMQKAGVDFGILGLDETCCGETARRMGQEYLFQVYAQQNIETLNKIKFNRVVTQCPHCFNTLKNEYPQLGGNYQVLHHSQLLAELSLPWAEISPNGNGIHGKVAYHDSCYLGRYNQVYAEPRQLLRQAKVDTAELPRHHENSFCCGGGGGQMWLETDANTRINHRRLDEVLQADKNIVATACPYCLLMFDDAIRSKGKGEQVQVLDVAEIIERQFS